MPGIFAREFPNNFESPVEVRRAPGMPGGSHDHRNAGLQSFANHNAQIALGAFAWASRLSGSQVIRPRIRGAGVATDEMRALFNGADESFLAKTGAEIACGG